MIFFSCTVVSPLQSEGKLLADKLKDAKVEVGYDLYNRVTHEFFGMAAVVPQVKDAQALVPAEIECLNGMMQQHSQVFR